MGSALRGPPKMSQVADWLLHIISRSPEIRAFCESNFNRPHKVFNGTVATDMPMDADAPFVTVERDRHIGGTMGEVRRGVRWELYKFVLAVGVVSDSIASSQEETLDQVEVETIEGAILAEELAYIVRDRLDEELPGSILIESCEVISTDTIHAPLFICILELVLSTPVALGGCASPLPPPP